MKLRTLLDYAMWYRKLGLNPIPVKTGGKEPLVGWKKYQSEPPTDAELKKWFGDGRQTNIGLVLGRGKIAVDLDGEGAINLLAEHGISLPADAPTCITGNGSHVLLSVKEPIGDCVALFSADKGKPQVDIRGVGFIVTEPSIHKNGKKYTWRIPPDREIPEIPPELLSAIVAKRKGSSNVLSGSRSHPHNIIPSGQRNDTLAGIAGALRQKGSDAQGILAALKVINEQQCEEPLPDVEISRIAQGMERYDPAPWWDKKTFLPAILAEEIIKKHSFLTSPIDDAGMGVRLYIYDGGVYRPNGADIARRFAHKLLGKASKPDRLDATITMIKESSKITVNELNPMGMDLINVKNGMLDWRTGKLKPHSPEYHSTFQIAATFHPGERSKALDRFLREVFPKDAQFLAEELIGYLLRPTTEFQKAFMLLGDGANGKSTFLDMLKDFLSKDCVSHISLQDLCENRFRAAELLNKLANMYSDLPSKSIENSDMFKNIVSGDIVTAERKFGHPFPLRPTARLLFSANELPTSKDLSNAYFRRWIVIPFSNRFEGANAKTDILLRLRTPEARSALLNCAVAGLQRLEQQRGFSACDSVKEAGQAYRAQCDSAYEFISTHLERRPGLKGIGKTEAHAAYMAFCKEVGTPPVSPTAFNRQVTKILAIKEGRNDGVRIWPGVFLKPGFKPMYYKQENKY